MDPYSVEIPGLTTLSRLRSLEAQNVASNTTAAPSEPTESANTTTASDTLISPNGQHTDASSAAENANSLQLDQPEQTTQTESSTHTAVDAPLSPPSLTQGLEALLGGLDPLPEQAKPTAQENLQNGGQDEEMQDGGAQEQQEEHPEWEQDSSPYESSSDSSSSDDSDDDSDDGKELLGPEEMARILMEGASDDEGEGKAKCSASGAQLRTKNEVPEEVIPRPDVTITPEMKIEELGDIEFIVDNTIVIKANTTGEYKVLDSGSVLCKEDRTIVAAVADLIGTVREPRYTARFTNEEEMKSLGLSLQTKIHYPVDHATFVFTEPLQSTKGTDASNWHDEEVGDDEMEFSDDEKEAEFKRQRKEKKKERQGVGRGGTASLKGGRGGRGGSHESPARDPSSATGLNYDDEDEGPYRKLARPAGFAQGPPAASGNEFVSPLPSRENFRGRGRGRGGHARGGHSLPPRNNNYQGFEAQPSQQQQAFPLPAFIPPPPPQFGNPGFQWPQAGQAPAWPQNGFGNFVPPPPPPQYTQSQQQQQAPNGQNGTVDPAAIFAAMQNYLRNQQQGGA